MHVERIVKVYTGLTMAYGLVRVHYGKESPLNGAAQVVAAPVLWPVYVLKDGVDRIITRRFTDLHEKRNGWNDT